MVQILNESANQNCVGIGLTQQLSMIDIDARLRAIPQLEFRFTVDGNLNGPRLYERLSVGVKTVL
jgi:hypothetical protein